MDPAASSARPHSRSKSRNPNLLKLVLGWILGWVYLLPWLGFYGMHHTIRAAERTSPERTREE